MSPSGFSGLVLCAALCATGLRAGVPATQAEAVKTTPWPGPAELFDAIDLDRPGLATVRTLAAAGRYDEAAEAYLSWRRTPGAFRWDVADTAAADRDRASLLGAADLIGENKLDPHGMVPPAFRGGLPYVNYGDKIDWTLNPVPPTDAAYTREYQYYINRMPFWETLSRAYAVSGEDRYARAWVAQLEGWMEQSPLPEGARPGDTLTWRTLEAGIRMSGSWPDAYARFLRSPVFTPEANLRYLSAVLAHGRRLSAGLADEGRSGNWVVTEACGLAALACCFPELKDAHAWRELALSRLRREAAFQVWPDGAQIELSPHYHNVVRDRFVFALRLARTHGLSMPDDFEDRVRSMYRYDLEMMDASGLTPMFNDGLPVNQLREGLGEAATLWPGDPLFRFAATLGTGAAPGTPPPADSDLLPYAGFAVMRSGWGKDDMALWFRAGPTGYAHGHEDKLSLQIALGGDMLLTEAGHFNYTRSAMRRYVLTTEAHSTATVDGLQQHRGNSSARPVRADIEWASSPLFDYASASYGAGYAKIIPLDRDYFPLAYDTKCMREIVHHRKVLFLRPSLVLVVDFFTGRGRHACDVFWHLDAEGAEVEPGSGSVVSRRTDGKGLSVVPFSPENLSVRVVQGRMTPSPLGWVAFERRPIPVAIQHAEGVAPVTVANVLVPWKREAPAVAVTPVDAGPGWWSGQVAMGRQTWRVWLRRPGGGGEPSGDGDMSALPSPDTALLVCRREGRQETAGAWGPKEGARLWQKSEGGDWRRVEAR